MKSKVFKIFKNYHYERKCSICCCNENLLNRMFLKSGDGSLKTIIGQKIAQATHKDLRTTNWALNLEICDDVNSAEDGPNQAIKAIRTRFQQRDDRQIENSLILLDTLVKNCGKRVHVLIATRDFMCELIRLVSPKDPSSTAVKDRALTFIERCSDAFKQDKSLSAVNEAYQYLKSQKVEFPAQNLDDMVSIHTPRASHSVIDPPMRSTTSQLSQQASPQQPEPQLSISNNDLMRINKELLVVRGNDAVMNEILSDVSQNPSPEDIQLLRDLHTTCKEMYKRMVALLEQIVDETLVCQLLDLIDKLNNTFLRYERYERNLAMSAPADRHGAPAPLVAPTPGMQNPPSQVTASSGLGEVSTNNVYAVPQSQPASNIDDLLSLDHQPSVPQTNPFIEAPITRLPPVQVNNEDCENIYTTSPARVPTSDNTDPTLISQVSDLGVDDEFDMFAQSRSSTLTDKVTAASSMDSYAAAREVPSMSSLSSAVQAKPAKKSEDDWLSGLASAAVTESTLSNEEFDQFLNERAPQPPRHVPGDEDKKKDDDNLLAL